MHDKKKVLNLCQENKIAVPPTPEAIWK